MSHPSPDLGGSTPAPTPAPASTSTSEKDASLSALPRPAASASASESASASWAPKTRSCVVCRSRKVRCDKLSPCSNCRRAGIECVFPSNDRPPRWARRLERITGNVASPVNPPEQRAADPQVMERLRNLESLVKELSGQLEQVNSGVGSTTGLSSSAASPVSSAQDRDTDHAMGMASTTTTSGVEKHFGRLVLQDASRSRYISSGFWSRVSDELDGLKMDTQALAGQADSDTSDEQDSPGKVSSTQEFQRPPSERHAFLFGHNLGPSPDLRDYRPLPSQIPFLLDVFSENVNYIIHIVHMPSVTKISRESRGATLSPSNEALMFAIYYAAVTSMEEDDVMTNFGSTKAELNLKYRRGLEHALAKADFLNVPDLVLVQAFAIFLFLGRRHDSPRFIWMMTGLAIRMAQALGLHRDGSHFPHLAPFEIENRRRVWWNLCMLDVRTSEDQGTDLTINIDSFDTKLPLNINDADIDPETKETPYERDGITDITVALVTFDMCDGVRRMMVPAAKGGSSLDEQSRLLDELYGKLERGYLQYSTETGDISYWVVVICTRLLISKMTLIIYLPTLFSSPSKHFSDAVRNKLLVCAIEVAEYNHALNSEQKARQWRWIYQTYSHWYAIVYMLLEINRRDWSPIAERAWIALHSSWLIPAQPKTDKNLRMWVPLRKLMAKALGHREKQLEQLRGNAEAIRLREQADQTIRTPASSGPFPPDQSEKLFRKHWNNLFTTSSKGDDRLQPSRTMDNAPYPSVKGSELNTPQSNPSTESSYGQIGSWPTPGFQNVGAYHSAKAGMIESQKITYVRESSGGMSAQGGMSFGQTEGVSGTSTSVIPDDWSGGRAIGPGFTPWLWADLDSTADVFTGTDVNMNVGAEVDWNNWLEFAKDMELDEPNGTGAN